MRISTVERWSAVVLGCLLVSCAEQPSAPDVRLGTGRITPAASVAIVGANLIVTGPASSSASLVHAYDAPTGVTVWSFLAYDAAFTAGVRVAVGDVTGDGQADIVTGAGPGSAPQVKVFSGATGAAVSSFLAYGGGFDGGVYVASGDVDGDGYADIITGAGPGATPQVKVFSGATLAEIYSFFAYGSAFTGGVSVASGDVDGDGFADIITGAGPGATPHVKVFSGATLAEIYSFFAYGSAFTGGVFVASADVDADGRADIVTGTGPGAGPNVKVFSGATLAEIYSFFAYDPAFSGGVFVAAGDVDIDGRADIVTGPGPGLAPNVKVFSGATTALIRSFFAYDPTFTGGVFVAAGGAGGSAAPNIDDLLAAVEQAISDGLLSGTGAGNSGPHRLTAWQNTLEEAKTYIESGDLMDACLALRDAYVHADGAASPLDFVVGAAREDLADMILDLALALGCSIP